VLRLEFHCHTFYSRDSLARPADILTACQHKGIDRVVITDHNSINGALEAQKLDPERVIVGEEIMTQSGELLAVFVREVIPAGLPSLEAIAHLRDQGAFISVSHPFDKLRSGHWELPALLEIAPLVDAIETFNARCYLPAFNQQASQFARKHNLPGTAGSDAHAVFEIGKVTMLVPDFEDANGLRGAILQCRVDGTRSGVWVHLASRIASLSKRIRKVGL
jgi:predicted metal-dependent phosphoesterase TrpH